jgi:hypothetical protein
MVQQSHRHHYVPEWYQRRFLAPGQTSFKVLDLQPPKFTRGDGSSASGRQISTKGPKSIFFENDLYTTRWLGAPNDEIERMLFGAIDRDGKTAIDAYIAEDWETVHSTYGYMYGFMDALRLRTPKGLHFVKFLTGSVPRRGGNSFLRYPCLKNFFHNCFITNDLKATKAWLSPLKRLLTEKFA